MTGQDAFRPPMLDFESRQLEEALLAHVQEAPAGFERLAGRLVLPLRNIYSAWLQR